MRRSCGNGAFFAAAVSAHSGMMFFEEKIFYCFIAAE
jgi:hypothetical protein